jgi:hypothetical protein
MSGFAGSPQPYRRRLYVKMALTFGVPAIRMVSAAPSYLQSAPPSAIKTQSVPPAPGHAANDG